MRRSPVLVLVGIIALSASLAGCSAQPAAKASVSAAPRTPTPSATPTISPALARAEHLVAQQGLAIALASNVLQTQLLLVQDSQNDGPLGCTALAGAGSHKITAWSGSASARVFTDVVYYDTGCTTPYLAAAATVHSTDAGASATASVAYTGVSGAALGTLTTTASASLSSTLGLEGTGTFTRPGTSPVSLGLACQFASDTVANCQGGVAQEFPALKQSLGLIAPLQLTVGSETSDPITFQGSGISYATAALGGLSIGSPDGKTLGLQGGTAQPSAITTSGQAGGFVLFPPTPTGWTVTDTADDVAFTISVVDNTSRMLSGTITQPSTKKQLATLSVDQSGTGTITYTGQKPATVVSWTLTN